MSAFRAAAHAWFTAPVCENCQRRTATRWHCGVLLDGTRERRCDWCACEACVPFAAGPEPPASDLTPDELVALGRRARGLRALDKGEVGA